MERKGFVSLWAGNFGTFKNAISYTEKNYSDEAQEDVELYKSELMKDFGIDMDGDYDEDFVECICNGRKTKSIAALIEGCSECEAVTKAFAEATGDELPDSFDSAILLFDYEYDGGTNVSAAHKAVFIDCVNVDYVDYDN